MAYEYGIHAKLNVDNALSNVEKLIKKLSEAEQKAGSLKVTVSVNNELVKQLASLKSVNNAQKEVATNTAKQAQEEAKLANTQERNATQKQKNLQSERMAEEQLATQKAKTAAQVQKNDQAALAAAQRLAAQKKADDDAAAQRAQKLRTEEQRTANEAEKAAQTRQKTEDAAAKAAQERANNQRRADQASEEYANRINEGRLRGEQRVQQEQERTNQSKINTLTAIARLYDQISRTQYNNEQREQKAKDATWRREQQIQKQQKANDDAIARDAEKQARIEKAQLEIEEQKAAKTKELRQAIEENQKAQANYNRVLAKALPTVNEIRQAMTRLSLSEENLKRAQYRANSPLSGLIGKVGPEGTWGNSLISLGGWVSKGGEVLQGITQAFDAIRRPAENLFSSIWSSANSFFNKATNGFMNLTQEGLEAFGTLEMAEIGFANFFEGSATEFTRKIKEEAVKMPMVGAADLARSVQYIAPLAGGNSNLALSAVEGVMKSIIYSGNDVSQYGTRALQNLTQIASGNLTAIDIKEMMRQMPALPRLLASTATGGELLQNGQITTSAVKNYIAKYGSDAILGVFKEISEKSEASDIYDVANQTVKGAIEQLREKTVLAWQDAFEKSGVADMVKDLLSSMSRDGGVVDQFFEQVAFYGQIITEWIKKNQDEIEQLLEALGEGLEQIGGTIKEVASETLGVLELVDGSGQINVQKLKEFIQQVTDFLKGLVKGYGTGLKNVISLVDNLRKKLGDDVFFKLGETIGGLASPMAKLISSLGLLASNAGRATGGILSMLGNLLKFGKFDTLITSAGEATTKMGARLERITGGRVSSAGFVGGVNKVAHGVGNVAGKGLRAASFIGLGVAADYAVDSLMEIAKVDDGVQKAVSGLTGSITGAAAGFQVFGLKGALIGGLIGAITGLVAEINEQKKELQRQKNQEAATQSKVVLDQTQEELKQYVIDQLGVAGYKLDTETKAGRFAVEMLEDYIAQQTSIVDENGKVIGSHVGNLYGKGQELAEMLTGWHRTKMAEEYLAGFTESTAFTNKDVSAGGRAIDFKTDIAARDWVADFVKRNMLQGSKDAYDYTAPNEQIVEDYLDDYQLTYEQLELLKSEENNIYNELSKQTTDFSSTLMNIDEGITKITDADSPLSKLTTYSEEFDQKLLTTNELLREIAVNTGSDERKFVDYGIPGGRFSSESAELNYQNWQKQVYRAGSNKIGDGSRFTRLTQLGKWLDSGRITREQKQQIESSPVNTRDNLAEVFGKKVGDNDDYMETYDKIRDAHLDAIDMRDRAPEGSEERAKWDDVLPQFSWWEKELAEIKPGDWLALFEFQNRAEKALGQYGVHFRAAGGIIDRLLSGRGRGVDTVPAFLQPGEFVMRKSAVDKAGTGVFAALNRGDFAGAAHALGSKFNSSWDNSHHWSNTITTNNNNTANNYFFAGGQVRGRRNPYRSIANRVATV